MKKYLLKSLALVCVLLLTFSLCGCGLLDQLGKVLPEIPFLERFDTMESAEQQETTEYVLTGPTDFYEEPDWDSPILATYYAGHTVVYNSVLTIDGVQWAGSNAGWFVLSGSKPDALLFSEADIDGILTEEVNAHTEPDAVSDVSSRLPAGQQVHISQIVMNGDEAWGLCDHGLGWVQIDDTFLDLEGLNSPFAFGVVRDDDACFYQAPNIYSGVVGTPECGSRYGLLTLVEIGGLIWAYTEEGWMPTDAIYEEGTTGFRPCSAIVIDPTPLNVRIAPGTDKDILTTLTYGDRVEILERINYNGSDWGFTGTGWIFMDLTEIQ